MVGEVTNHGKTLEKLLVVHKLWNKFSDLLNKIVIYFYGEILVELLVSAWTIVLINKIISCF